MIYRPPTRLDERQAQLAIVRAAFTLMEMLIVVAIIIALASLGGYYFMGALKTNQKKIAQTNVEGMLNTAVNNYMIDHGMQPPQSLQQLVLKDSVGGPYLKSANALIDPWGNPYGYNPHGVNPENGEQQPEIFTICPTDGTRISNLGYQKVH
jgi:general secretion pathway protein G